MKPSIKNETRSLIRWKVLTLLDRESRIYRTQDELKQETVELDFFRNVYLNVVSK